MTNVPRSASRSTEQSVVAATASFLASLEKAVKPILEPMMLRHEETTLNIEQQGLLATWVVKSAYLLELAWRQRYPDARPIEGYVASATGMGVAPTIQRATSPVACLARLF